MKVITLTHGEYHRNGISGEGFYSAKIIYKGEEETHYNFLVTFTENNNKVDSATCRVINLDDLHSNWRGDMFGDAIQDYFRRKKVKNIYDFLTTKGVN